MTENNSHEPADDAAVDTDGGTITGAAQHHRDTDYLNREVNLLKPSTPFMRDHLKLVWGSFAVWILATWGPVVATFLAPSTMTSLTILGFPAHYFTVALFAPTSSLVLAAIYARRRDKLDEKYGIDTTAPTGTASSGSGERAATDGGVNE